MVPQLWIYDEPISFLFRSFRNYMSYFQKVNISNKITIIVTRFKNRYLSIHAIRYYKYATVFCLKVHISKNLYSYLFSSVLLCYCFDFIFMFDVSLVCLRAENNDVEKASSVHVFVWPVNVRLFFSVYRVFFFLSFFPSFVLFICLFCKASVYSFHIHYIRTSQDILPTFPLAMSA